MKLFKLMKTKEEFCWNKFYETGEVRYAAQAAVYSEIALYVVDEESLEEECKKWGL